MQSYDLGGLATGIRGRARRYLPGTGAQETHLLLVPDRPGSFDRQLQRLEQAYAAALGELGLAAGSVVFRRLFGSDLANQRAALGASALNRGAAVSCVEQPPLPDAKLALYAYHVADPASPPRTTLAGDGAVLWEHRGRTHLAATGLTLPGEGSSYDQMRGVLVRFDRMLADRCMTLLEHALRTWIYLPALDMDYQGIVRARREFFADHGLTKETHYLASTGIAGGAGDPAVRVMMDAIAVQGLAPEQVHYLHALDHLSLTHLYGVTFERGTAVTYGDRTHVLLSGTASIDAQGQIVHPGDVLRQLDRTLENMAALLADAGATLDDMTYMLIYLRDGADRRPIEQAFRRRLPEMPYVILRAPVCRPGWLIEIEGSAILPAGNPAFAPF
jgi:enamine deaminase RidA (YjgF/YER057c/UK114 family)